MRLSGVSAAVCFIYIFQKEKQKQKTKKKKTEEKHINFAKVVFNFVLWVKR
jgi:hypothetical protein